MSLVDTAELEQILAQHYAAISELQSMPPYGLQDVTQYGVRGDGVTDDHAAIQNLFAKQFDDTAANKRTRTLYFPGGQYRIKQPLRIRPQWAFRVMGGGVTANVKRFWGNNAELVYDGPPGKPVVTTEAFGLHWDGLNINGSWKASIGMLIDRENKLGKPPAGKYYVPSISIRNCETGVQVGGELGTWNCDWLCWGFLNIEHCDVGYNLNNQMGIHHHITMYRPYGTKTLVHVNGGGNMNVENLGVVHGAKKILHFGQPGGSSNTAQFRFSNVKQDSKLDDVLWFSQENNDAGMVKFENFHLANDHLKAPLFQVTGYVALTLRDGWGLPKGAIDAKSVTTPNGKTWSPNILVERCKCASSVQRPEDLFGALTGTCYTTTRDLLAGNGTPIE